MKPLQKAKQYIPQKIITTKGNPPSVFIIAFFVFIAGNLFFAFLDSRYVISAKTRNERYFDFPGLKKLCLQFQNTGKTQILLLGSSLFVHPLRSIDKSLGEKMGLQCSDFSRYHATAHLDSLVKLANIDCKNICNLAVGGAMISDYYLLFNKYISSKNHCPNIVIVGCAPRAFYDSGLVNAQDTPLFGYLFDGLDAFALGKHYLPSVLSQIDFFGKYFFPLYGHRKWLSCSLNEYMHSLWVPILNTSSLISNNSEKPSKPIDPSISSSVAEYRRHYSGISFKNIQTQIYFLKLLAQSCNQRNIKLVLLNMPLSSFNKNLLEPEFYYSYKHHVEKIAQNSGAFFCDLDSSKKYEDSDFDDSVHLNLRGATKLENHMVSFIKKIHSNNETKISSLF